MSMMIEEFYTVKEFASLLRVHPSTIRRAIACGRVQALRIGSGPKASFRIFKSELGRIACFDSSKVIEKIVESRLER